MKPSEVLRKAAEKIATPEKWINGLLATDADGDEIHGIKRLAEGVRFCLEGAVWGAATTPVEASNATGFMNRVTHRSLHAWNDEAERTHTEVLAALTKAAELAESEGQ